MNDDELLVIYADAGQGDCTLIFFPKGEVWMIDCGCKINRDVSAAVLAQLPQVIERGFRKRFGNDWETKRDDHERFIFDLLIITHPDSDHYNLIEGLVEGNHVTFNCVDFGGDVQDYGLYEKEKLEKMRDGLQVELLRLQGISYGLRSTSVKMWNIYAQIDEITQQITSLSSNGEVPWIREWLNSQTREDCRAGQPLTYGGVTLTFLAKNFYDDHIRLHWSCQNYQGTRSNGNSIVILIEYKNNKFFFMGDATELVERCILEQYREHDTLNNTKTTILKLSHHGSHTSSIEEWIEALQPDIAVISSDVRSFGGVSLPRKSLIDRVCEHSKNIGEDPGAQIRSHSFYYWEENLRGTDQEELRLEENTDWPICTTLYSVMTKDDNGEPKGEYAGGAWWFSVDNEGNLHHQLEDSQDANPQNDLPELVEVKDRNRMDVDVEV